MCLASVLSAPRDRERQCFAASVFTHACYNQGMEVIVKNRDILGGTPVFRGTRVPVQVLFDYLEGGETLEDFLDGFPTVSRESAVTVLEEAKQFLLSRP
jgi:uncharacterized protein (DUF433 family)